MGTKKGERTGRDLLLVPGVAQQFLDRARAIIFVVDAAGKVAAVNRPAEDALGWARGDLIGRDWFDTLLPTEAKEDAVIEFHDLLAGRRDVPEAREHTVVTKGGAPYPIARRDTILRDEEGVPIGLMLCGHDITDRGGTPGDRTAREAPCESEERYRELFENTPDILFLTDLDGKVIDINPAGLRFSGYDRNEVIGRNILESYTNPEDRKLLIQTVFERGYAEDFEVGIRKKDGTAVDCRVTAVPRRDRHGNVIGFHGSIEDISEKKRLEQQVIRTQRMEALSALAGGIAHNFNNILVGIMGYSEYLLSKKEPDDRDYRALKTIHEGALRASELTRQLLSTTRGERHSPTKMNLNDVVEKVLPLVAGTFDTTIEIETHLARDLMLIEGDPGQWEQSLLNLCINARDAMPTGGRLVIETENKVLDEDFAKTHLGARVGSHVILSVTDTGVGIAPEIKDRIFEPFFTTKAKSGGTGMGLSTVWGIVKDHRGHITVYSEPGAGTTFRICIPALEGSMEVPESADEIEDSSGSETILLVDDEATVREIWGDFLREKGYRVITAENGKEGIDAFCRHRGEVDLIIVDFVMPGLGGEKTAQKIREIEPRAKVLFTSGYSKNGPIGEYLNGGTDPFIQKPVPLKELGNKVREILNKKGER